jgi:hypothetical protein
VDHPAGQARRRSGDDAARAEAAITADAGQCAQAARDEAARRVLARAKDEAASTAADAVREAARTRELARQRMPSLVDLAIGLIWQLQAGEDNERGVGCGRATAAGCAA